MRSYLLPFLLVPLFLAACSDSDHSDSPEIPLPDPDTTYSAEVRRTEYGIPHIKADDWGSLGYGFGYAYGQDNFCVVMREIVFATGRSAELMGEAEGNIDTDFMMRFLNGSNEEFRKKYFDQAPEYVRNLVIGYVDGLLRYLEETGVENLPEGDLGCRNADWVYAFDEIDLLIFMRRISLGGSSDQGTFRSGILAASGPDAVAAARAAGNAIPRQQALDNASEGLRWMANEMRNFERGSNALAFGSSATQNGGGLLLGNPHQPWFGAGAWYEAHLTIPGEFDVAGVSLHGYPFIGIGFNKDVAWTHTVSFANRFSFYELPLNPDNPMQYDYDGEWRDIT
ncbi:MAG: peptidase S45, partial [Gammaproteobacteria bacterium]